MIPNILASLLLVETQVHDFACHRKEADLLSTSRPLTKEKVDQLALEFMIDNTIEETTLPKRKCRWL